MLKQCVSLESKKCHHLSRSLETGFNIFQVNNSYCHRKKYISHSFHSIVGYKQRVYFVSNLLSFNLELHQVAIIVIYHNMLIAE